MRFDPGGPRRTTSRVVIFTGAGQGLLRRRRTSPRGGFDFTDLDRRPPGRSRPGRCSKRIFLMNKPVIARRPRGGRGGRPDRDPAVRFSGLAATDARFRIRVRAARHLPRGRVHPGFLPRLVGLGRALDWMVSGRVFDRAAEAHDAGLVTRLYEPDDVLPSAYELASRV